MPYKEVWVDDEDLSDFDDLDLIDELLRRKYTIYGKKYDLVWELYQAYLLDNEKAFREYVKKILIENGYRP